MEHIVKLVGYPDALWGSGVYIYAYRLKDGTYVGIGHDGYEHVLYVQHGEEFIVNNMSNEQMNERGVPRTRGYVADAATAIRIAEAVCEPIYGVERLANQRPFHTSYTNGTWIVRGRRAASGQAEVLFVEIAERDGRVLKMGYDTNSY
ncbi:MAG: NTF2 fold immunity protein [Limisphaerales bacterium]